MLLVSYHPTTSTKRWKKSIVVWHPKNRVISHFLKFKTHHKKTLKGRVAIHGTRRMYKTPLWELFIAKPLQVFFVAVSHYFSVRPLREFFLGKTIFNNYKLFPFTEGITPGFKLLAPGSLFLRLSNFASQLLKLKSVPLNSIISFVYNVKNTKMTFAKSSGCSAVRRKNIKKTKLVYVQLPSQKLIVLSPETYCVLAPSNNLHLDRIVEGKWGSFPRCTKNINVRGVAKNPVDHPNGGRTKAKQPELSPWGWIAKNSK